ncbi:hypothetical protein JMJ35_000154 [Cladonia borealis]|uniref:Short-chain dehydrogenase n=1 Tax=Cladonia borealis TaxID=184061 RepID=A0AA39RAW4_9LECA|nr:hypothetical protein JMJ35_000154 [Cladonia borealis]
MSFQYKKILVIGATSGIGEALASRFVKQGSSVIVVGRRKDKLEQFVHEHGKENASAVPFDITELQKIPNFVTNITETHPDLDCVFINSGIQRTFDFSKPETVDLAVVQEEFNTNYLSYLASYLHYIWARLGAYHQMCQLLCHVNVVELFPPAVQTELHDKKHQPDIENGRSIGMPLDDFVEDAYNGLAAGKEEVAVQFAKQWYDAFEPQRQELFHKLDTMMKKSHGGK